MKNALRLPGLALAFTLALTSAGCGTSTGNPVVTIDTESASPLSRLFERLLPSAYAAVNELRVCFKRVRFKPEGKPTNSDVAQDEDNRDFEIGERVLSGGGSTLGTVVVGAGIYRRVEFDFDSHCGFSVSVANDNPGGPFSTSETISMRFEGSFVLDSDATIALNSEAVLGDLANVTEAGQIRSLMLARSGSLRKK
ncbi:MAG: hypothetical protein NDJ90_08965 [Oligoflexia bacterium]|nr:hypothetical protein [Oligoflexia bacterium]